MPRVRAIALRSSRAQAMVEVAIFGAIIVFLIGAIVKSVVATSFAQHFALRTMRQALTEASTQSFDDCNGGSVRKPYSLIIIEDRLVPGVAKYGATERAPYVGTSSAMFTRDLFHLPQPGCAGEIPKLNMLINGQTYSYSLADWTSFPSSSPCVMAVANPPGAGSSWSLVGQNIKSVVDEKGFGPCLKMGATGGIFPAPVYQDGSNPPQYYMLDPTAGDMNPFDPSQGLQQDVSIVTSVLNGTLMVQPGSSYSGKTQTDTICRTIRTNSGNSQLCTDILDNRGHWW